MSSLRTSGLLAASFFCPIAYSQQPSSKVAAGTSPKLVAEAQTIPRWKMACPGSGDAVQPTLWLYTPLDLGLYGNFVHRALHTPGLGQVFPCRASGSQAAPGTLQRSSRHPPDTSHISVQRQR